MANHPGGGGAGKPIRRKLILFSSFKGSVDGGRARRSSHSPKPTSEDAFAEKSPATILTQEGRMICVHLGSNSVIFH